MPRPYIDPHLGYIPQRHETGKRQTPTDVTEINREKDICLTCTRRSCKGCGPKKFKKKLLKSKEKRDVH